MGQPGSIRVSAWAADELKRRAKAEGRTLVGVVDRLLMASGSPLPFRTAAEVGDQARVEPVKTANRLGRAGRATRAEVATSDVPAVADVVTPRFDHSAGGIPIAGVSQAAKDLATQVDRQIVDTLTASFSAPRCAKCGCSKVCHEQGTHSNRCERHPSCVWS